MQKKSLKILVAGILITAFFAPGILLAAEDPGAGYGTHSESYEGAIGFNNTNDAARAAAVRVREELKKNPNLTQQQRQDLANEINVAAEEAAKQSHESHAPEDTTPCFDFPILNVGACVRVFLAWIVNILLSLFSWVLWLAGKIFDLMLQISVLDFSKYANMSGLKTAWATLRDLANIFFIFILLYIAIGTALRLSNVNAQKMIVKIVIIALLINFSAVFTRTIIDAGNVLAVFFYQKAAGEADWGVSGRLVDALKITDLDPRLKESCAGKYLGQSLDSQPPTTLNTPTTKDCTESTVSNWQIIIAGIGGIILILITSFVLLAAGLFLAYRTAILLFLIVVSPLAYLLMIFPDIPGLSGQSGKFWENLLKQTFFAPVYMALFMSVIIMVSGGSATGQGANFVQSISTAGVLGTILGFIIVIFLMFACLIVANSMGAYGAGAATSMAKKWSGALGRGTYKKTLPALARRTVGRAAASIANSDRLARWASKNTILGSWAYRAQKGLDATSKASFGGAVKEGYIGAQKQKREYVKGREERLRTDTRTGEKTVGARLEHANRYKEGLTKYPEEPKRPKESDYADRTAYDAADKKYKESYEAWKQEVADIRNAKPRTAWEYVSTQFGHGAEYGRAEAAQFVDIDKDKARRDRRDKARDRINERLEEIKGELQDSAISADRKSELKDSRAKLEGDLERIDAEEQALDESKKGNRDRSSGGGGGGGGSSSAGGGGGGGTP